MSFEDLIDFYIRKYEFDNVTYLDKDGIKLNIAKKLVEMAVEDYYNEQKIQLEKR